MAGAWQVLISDPVRHTQEKQKEAKCKNRSWDFGTQYWIILMTTGKINHKINPLKT